MHTVDLSPIYQQVNELIVLVLTGVITWLGAELRSFLVRRIKFLSAQTDTEMANSVNRALQNGMAIALNQAQAWETAHKDVQVQGAIQAFAAQYAINHSPDAVAHFGLTPQALAKKALAFLPPPPSLTGTIVIGKPSPSGQTPVQEADETAALNRAQAAQG